MLEEQIHCQSSNDKVNQRLSNENIENGSKIINKEENKILFNDTLRTLTNGKIDKSHLDVNYQNGLKNGYNDVGKFEIRFDENNSSLLDQNLVFHKHGQKRSGINSLWRNENNFGNTKLHANLNNGDPHINYTSKYETENAENNSSFETISLKETYRNRLENGNIDWIFEDEDKCKLTIDKEEVTSCPSNSVSIDHEFSNSNNNDDIRLIDIGRNVKHENFKNNNIKYDMDLKSKIKNEEMVNNQSKQAIIHNYSIDNMNSSILIDDQTITTKTKNNPINIEPNTMTDNNSSLFTNHKMSHKRHEVRDKMYGVYFKQPNKIKNNVLINMDNHNEIEGENYQKILHQARFKELEYPQENYFSNTLQCQRHDLDSRYYPNRNHRHRNSYLPELDRYQRNNIHTPFQSASSKNCYNPALYIPNIYKNAHYPSYFEDRFNSVAERDSHPIDDMKYNCNITNHFSNYLRDGYYTEKINRPKFMDSAPKYVWNKVPIYYDDIYQEDKIKCGYQDAVKNIKINHHKNASSKEVFYNQPEYVCARSQSSEQKEFDCIKNLNKTNDVSEKDSDNIPIAIKSIYKENENIEPDYPKFTTQFNEISSTSIIENSSTRIFIDIQNSKNQEIHSCISNFNGTLHPQHLSKTIPHLLNDEIYYQGQRIYNNEFYNLRHSQIYDRSNKWALVPYDDRGIATSYNILDPIRSYYPYISSHMTLINVPIVTRGCNCENIYREQICRHFIGHIQIPAQLVIGKLGCIKNVRQNQLYEYYYYPNDDDNNMVRVPNKFISIGKHKRNQYKGLKNRCSLRLHESVIMPNDTSVNNNTKFLQSNGDSEFMRMKVPYEINNQQSSPTNTLPKSNSLFLDFQEPIAKSISHYSGHYPLPLIPSTQKYESYSPQFISLDSIYANDDYYDKCPKSHKNSVLKNKKGFKSGINCHSWCSGLFISLWIVIAIMTIGAILAGLLVALY
ncbi:unnamed protein product [Gordionus sp. m RMFG-2023]